MSTLESVKNGGVNVLSTMSSIHNMSSIFTDLNNKGQKKQWKKNQRNEQPWIVAYTLVLQTMSSPLNVFWSKPIGFLSKMMSCKLNHNLIFLGHEPSSKSLGTNLKLLTNKNV
jgi:hypothetical protein